MNIHNSSNLTVETLEKELQLNPQRLEETDSNGRTPLLAACFAKQWSLARWLVEEKGANASVKDRVSVAK
jgi:hypothetical protein